MAEAVLTPRNKDLESGLRTQNRTAHKHENIRQRFGEKEKMQPRDQAACKLAAGQPAQPPARPGQSLPAVAGGDRGGRRLSEPRSRESHVKCRDRLARYCTHKGFGLLRRDQPRTTV